MCILLLVVAFCVPTFASTMVLNDSWYDVTTYSVNGRNLIPLRQVGELLNLQVQYDNGYIYLNDNNIGIVCNIYDNEVIAIYPDGTTSTGYVDVGPTMIAGKAYVPIRFLAEAFGYQVEYDTYSGATYINSYY